MKKDPLPQGAELHDDGVRFRVWAPDHASAAVQIWGEGEEIARTLPMRKDAAGYHAVVDHEAGPGTLYKYLLDGSQALPDPASRWQPQGVHGPSMVVDPGAFGWRGPKFKRPAVRDLVIYELHVGTFTEEGNFLAAIDRLDELADLGINAIELMPVADFPGDRNWGYDGVLLYAPSRAYGHPDDLRALVDAAHQAGICVILDVVYNHFGPDGNYLGAFSPNFFNEAHHTPWGAANNFDGKQNGPVRAFFVANPIYWMEEFRIDGFRFDATHAIVDDSPRHVLAEMTDAVHARGGFALAEDSQNDVEMITPTASGGHGFDGIWADDFHHVVRVGQTEEAEGYYRDFTGTPAELAETLTHGWLYRGQLRRSAKKRRGTECRHVPPERFVHCLSNHDQVGNRALGERVSDVISPAGYRAASMLLCLSPYTPLLFMGQEWAASTPFLYFTDHHEALGKLVTEGRRREFADFAAFQDPATREQIPDPQSEQTFYDSKLDWSERDRPAHGDVLALYRECLALRRAHKVFRPRGRDKWQVAVLDGDILALRFKDSGGDWLLVVDLEGGHSATLSANWIAEGMAGKKWSLVLSSNESRFGGTTPFEGKQDLDEIEFPEAEAILLRASKG